MSDSYSMDDYIKENIIDKYNLRKSVNGYQIGIFPTEYGRLLCKQDENIWYTATDAHVLFLDNIPSSILYIGYTAFNSISIVTNIIDSVNEKLKKHKEESIKDRIKSLEKDFIDETL